MSIRFKFRSSVNFDLIDIEGRPSISVRDLKSKIVRQKNLNISQDLDLVFSDALTGQEYDDKNFLIPSGSSIIIKRVPAGTVPSALAPIDTVENFGMNDSNLFNPMSGQMDDFEDLGLICVLFLRQPYLILIWSLIGSA
ncbi:unnamed protein product [Ilex paraguariensis]|uniref:DWNN domain-containing protein n=1 Tax=Ilex paraguariensis TaxID=185542 RepID=A0ABC8SYP6_9AQUA